MTLADRLLLLLSTIGIASLAFFTWQGEGLASDRVEIRTPFATEHYALQQDQTVTVRGALGLSEIQIQQRQVRFVNSPCASGFCIHQGWAKGTGEVRACLPNQISLRLLGGPRTYDSIVF